MARAVGPGAAVVAVVQHGALAGTGLAGVQDVDAPSAAASLEPDEVVAAAGVVDVPSLRADLVAPASGQRGAVSAVPPELVQVEAVPRAQPDPLLLVLPRALGYRAGVVPPLLGGEVAAREGHDRRLVPRAGQAQVRVTGVVPAERAAGRARVLGVPLGLGRLARQHEDGAPRHDGIDAGARLVGGEGGAALEGAGRGSGAVAVGEAVPVPPHGVHTEPLPGVVRLQAGGHTAAVVRNVEDQSGLGVLEGGGEVVRRAVGRGRYGAGGRFELDGVVVRAAPRGDVRVEPGRAARDGVVQFAAPLMGGAVGPGQLLVGPQAEGLLPGLPVGAVADVEVEVADHDPVLAGPGGGTDAPEQGSHVRAARVDVVVDGVAEPDAEGAAVAVFVAGLVPVVQRVLDDADLVRAGVDDHRQVDPAASPAVPSRGAVALRVGLEEVHVAGVVAVPPHRVVHVVRQARRERAGDADRLTDAVALVCRGGRPVAGLLEGDHLVAHRQRADLAVPAQPVVGALHVVGGEGQAAG